MTERCEPSYRESHGLWWALGPNAEELGFQDLAAHDGADSILTDALRQVPKTALRNAERWKMFGPALVDHFETLRGDLGSSERDQAMKGLHKAVLSVGGEGRW